jgi:cell division septation protein DedD
MRISMFMVALAVSTSALSLQPVSAFAKDKGKASASNAASVKDGVDAWSRGEYETAVRIWREPAVRGDSDAQFNMAQAYKFGRGVKQDLAIAADWYRQAASRGHLQAEDSYAHLLHYQGKVADALPLLAKSADRGEPRSQYLLATELFNGTNVKKDWVRAYALMTRASSAGLAPASRSLAQMDQFIPFDQRQQGTVLAGDLERRSKQVRSDQVAGFPIDTRPQAPVVRPVDVPPSEVVEPSYPSYPGPVASPPVRPAQPAPQPPVRAVRAPAPAASGKWRIQLGAFGNESNATKLWTSLEARVGGLQSLTPYLVSAGKITRLQAGPFASKGSAEAMCAKVKSAGQGCLAISN